MLLDQGEKLDLDETKKHVNERTVLDWLSYRFPDEKYNIILKPLTEGIRSKEISDFLWKHQGLVDRDISNNGLCYLIAIVLC